MDEEMIRDSLITWVAVAKAERKLARRCRKWDLLVSAESLGKAQGIMLMARTMKGYGTQAYFVNLARRRIAA